MENKLTLSKELVAGNSQLSNIKNNPLKVGDVVEVGALIEQSLTKDAKGNDLATPVRTDYFSGRVGHTAVKIPANELLRMQAGVTNEDGSFTAYPKFKVTEATPRRSKDGVILFPLKYSTKFEKFLNDKSEWNADNIAMLRAAIPSTVTSDETKAIQDYTVVAQ
jgi:hypothetical protein